MYLIKRGSAYFREGVGMEGSSWGDWRRATIFTSKQDARWMLTTYESYFDGARVVLYNGERR